MTRLEELLAGKISKAGDTMTGALVVLAPTALDHVVRKSDLIGGIQRPYRVFPNVAAAPVGAMVRTGMSAPIVDSLNLGQVYALTLLRLKVLTAPAVSTTVKGYRDGVEFFSLTLLLAALPAVGRTLDLLALAAAPVPADIVLPATLTFSASSGTFEVLADGILK